MKKTLEKLWNEHFAEECAQMNTEKEKALIQKAVEAQKAMDELLTNQQSEATQNYIEILYEMQGFFAKKAFFTGCEFATSFFLEAGSFGKE